MVEVTGSVPPIRAEPKDCADWTWPRRCTARHLELPDSSVTVEEENILMFEPPGSANPAYMGFKRKELHLAKLIAIHGLDIPPVRWALLDAMTNVTSEVEILKSRS